MQDTDTAAQTATDAATDAAADAPNKLQHAEDLLGRVLEGDFSQQTWLDLWATLGWPIVQAIVLIIAVLLVSGWARGLMSKAMRRAHVEETLVRFFGNAARWIIMLLGALMILSTFGVDTTSFAAVLAAMGFAIGMALSGTLGNFAAGIMLLVFRPFKVGDVVNAAGVTAKVDEIGMFTTTFDTPDNRRIIVPNGKIFGDTIENISHHATRRVDVAVGVDYGCDVDEARKVLEQVCASVEGGLSDPAPVVYMTELGASSVDFALRVWSNAADYWAVRERMTRDAKKALDAAGIGIPFPQRDLHLPDGIEVTVKNG